MLFRDMTSTDPERLLTNKRKLDARMRDDPRLAERLFELRAWQAARLARTYDDFRRDPRFSQAVEFFLSDLYGAKDYTRRDDEVIGAWSRLKRTLPEAALEALVQAIELEVLSADLDQAMVAQLAAGPVTETTYAAAYRAVGRPDARKRQIELVVSMGQSLNRIVQKPLIGAALRMARVPAYVSGFGVLQDFLERGYAAFRKMQGSESLLDAIRSREMQLSEALLSGSANPIGGP
jgi:hypothetical protein